MSEPDDRVREVLDEHGDDGTTPRHTLFYFYDGDIVGLIRAAEADGYTTTATVKQPGVILERHMAVDEDSFDPVVERMEDWADEFGCTFDGWECEMLLNRAAERLRGCAGGATALNERLNPHPGRPGR